jgi:hypothetical protein
VIPGPFAFGLVHEWRVTPPYVKHKSMLYMRS